MLRKGNSAHLRNRAFWPQPQRVQGVEPRFKKSTRRRVMSPGHIMRRDKAAATTCPLVFRCNRRPRRRAFPGLTEAGYRAAEHLRPFDFAPGREPAERPHGGRLQPPGYSPPAEPCNTASADLRRKSNRFGPPRAEYEPCGAETASSAVSQGYLFVCLSLPPQRHLPPEAMGQIAKGVPDAENSPELFGERPEPRILSAVITPEWATGCDHAFRRHVAENARSPPVFGPNTHTCRGKARILQGLRSS